MSIHFGENKVDISIIVCCYNGNDTINSCLESLLNQKRDNIYIEVLLIDDGSSDGTAEKIGIFLENKDQFEKIEFNYFRKKNQGLSIARNFGMEKSKSKIIAYIDEDAIADSKFSKNIVEIFNNNEDFNCIGGEVFLLNSTNSFANLIQNSIFSYQMKSETAVIGTNMAFRKKTIKSVGGFQPEFTYRGDESALFAKGKNIINIYKSSNVIIHHPQPSKLILWLKTRYENGYFGAAIYHLDKRTSFVKLKRLLFCFIQLLLPLISFGFYLFFKLKWFVILSIIFYLLFLFKRFVYSKIIFNYVKEYHLNISELNLTKDLQIILLTFLGFMYEDYGYLNGYFKYNNTKWKASVY